jgi:hypothetical protein
MHDDLSDTSAPPPRNKVKPVVSEVSSKNSTTGCYTFSIEVTMHNTQGCPVPQLDDVDPGCESVCSLVSNCTCRCHR